MRTWLLAIILLLPLSVRATPCDGIPGEQQVTVQLFYGRAHKDGSQINPAEWADYIAKDVTPRFPGGLTVIEASGQWQHPKTGRVMREKSTIIEIVTTSSPETWARMQELRDIYKKRFQQEIVGLVANLSCASW
jgi:hypothetical protein